MWSRHRQQLPHKNAVAFSPPDQTKQQQRQSPYQQDQYRQSNFYSANSERQNHQTLSPPPPPLQPDEPGQRHKDGAYSVNRSHRKPPSKSQSLQQNQNGQRHRDDAYSERRNHRRELQPPSQSLQQHPHRHDRQRHYVSHSRQHQHSTALQHPDSNAAHVHSGYHHFQQQKRHEHQRQKRWNPQDSADRPSATHSDRHLSSERSMTETGFSPFSAMSRPLKTSSRHHTEDKEQLLRSLLCMAGKTFLLAVVSDSLDRQLFPQIKGLGGNAIRTSVNGGLFAVLTDLKMTTDDQRRWHVNYVDPHTVHSVLQRVRQAQADREEPAGKRDDDGVVRKYLEDGRDVTRATGESVVAVRSPFQKAVTPSAIEISALPPSRGKDMLKAVQQQRQQQTPSSQPSQTSARPRFQPPAPHVNSFNDPPTQVVCQWTSTLEHRPVNRDRAARTSDAEEHPSRRSPENGFCPEDVPEDLKSFLTKEEYHACLHVAKEEGEKLQQAEHMGLEVYDARMFFEHSVKEQFCQVQRLTRKMSTRSKYRVYAKVQQDNLKIAIRVEHTSQSYAPCYKSFSWFPRDRLILPSGPPLCPPWIPPLPPHPLPSPYCIPPRRGITNNSGDGNNGKDRHAFEFGVDHKVSPDRGAQRVVCGDLHQQQGVNNSRHGEANPSGASSGLTARDSRRAVSMAKSAVHQPKSRRELFPEKDEERTKRTLTDIAAQKDMQVPAENAFRDRLNKADVPHHAQTYVSDIQARRTRAAGSASSRRQQVKENSSLITHAENDAAIPDNPVSSNKRRLRNDNRHDNQYSVDTEAKEVQKRQQGHLFEHTISKYRRVKHSFCEICREDYYTLREHIQFSKHLERTGNSEKYRELNEFLNTLPAMDTFLQKSLEQYQGKSGSEEKPMICTTTSTTSSRTMTTHLAKQTPGITISPDEEHPDQQEISVDEVVACGNGQTYRRNGITADEVRVIASTDKDILEMADKLAKEISIMYEEAFSYNKCSDELKLLDGVRETDGETELISPSEYSMFPLVNSAHVKDVQSVTETTRPHEEKVKPIEPDQESADGPTSIVQPHVNDTPELHKKMNHVVFDDEHDSGPSSSAQTLTERIPSRLEEVTYHVKQNNEYNKQDVERENEPGSDRYSSRPDGSSSGRPAPSYRMTCKPGEHVTCDDTSSKISKKHTLHVQSPPVSNEAHADNVGAATSRPIRMILSSQEQCGQNLINVSPVRSSSIFRPDPEGDVQRNSNVHIWVAPQPPVSKPIAAGHSATRTTSKDHVRVKTSSKAQAAVQETFADRNTVKKIAAQNNADSMSRTFSSGKNNTCEANDRAQHGHDDMSVETSMSEQHSPGIHRGLDINPSQFAAKEDETSGIRARLQSIQRYDFTQLDAGKNSVVRDIVGVQSSSGYTHKLSLKTFGPNSLEHKLINRNKRLANFGEGTSASSNDLRSEAVGYEDEATIPAEDTAKAHSPVKKIESNRRQTGIYSPPDIDPSSSGEEKDGSPGVRTRSRTARSPDLKQQPAAKRNPLGREFAAEGGCQTSLGHTQGLPSGVEVSAHMQAGKPAKDRAEFSATPAEVVPNTVSDKNSSMIEKGVVISADQAMVVKQVTTEPIQLARVKTPVTFKDSSGATPQQSFDNADNMLSHSKTRQKGEKKGSLAVSAEIDQTIKSTSTALKSDNKPESAKGKQALQCSLEQNEPKASDTFDRKTNKQRRRRSEVDHLTKAISGFSPSKDNRKRLGERTRQRVCYNENSFSDELITILDEDEAIKQPSRLSLKQNKPSNISKIFGGKPNKQTRRMSGLDQLSIAISGFSPPRDKRKERGERSKQRVCYNEDSFSDELMAILNEDECYEQPVFDQDIKTKKTLRKRSSSRHEKQPSVSSRGTKRDRKVTHPPAQADSPSGLLKREESCVERIPPSVPLERRKIQKRLLKALKAEDEKQSSAKSETNQPEEYQFYRNTRPDFQNEAPKLFPSNDKGGQEAASTIFQEARFHQSKTKTGSHRTQSLSRTEINHSDSFQQLGKLDGQQRRTPNPCSYRNRSDRPRDRSMSLHTSPCSSMLLASKMHDGEQANLPRHQSTSASPKDSVTPFLDPASKQMGYLTSNQTMFNSQTDTAQCDKAVPRFVPVVRGIPEGQPHTEYGVDVTNQREIKTAGPEVHRGMTKKTRRKKNSARPPHHASTSTEQTQKVAAKVTETQNSMQDAADVFAFHSSPEPMPGDTRWDKWLRRGTPRSSQRQSSLSPLEERQHKFVPNKCHPAGKDKTISSKSRKTETPGRRVDNTGRSSVRDTTLDFQRDKESRNSSVTHSRRNQASVGGSGRKSYRRETEEFVGEVVSPVGAVGGLCTFPETVAEEARGRNAGTLTRRMSSVNRGVSTTNKLSGLVSTMR